MPRPPRAARLLALAAAWGAAAWYLLGTEVPSDLVLPDLDPSRFFRDPVLDETASYERFLRFDRLLADVVLLAVLGVYAARGAVFVRESAAGRIGTGMLLGMLGLGLVWFAQVPFGLAALWWGRRHDVTDQSYLEWLFADWWILGSGFLFISLALLVVMGLAGPLGDRWWILGAPVFVGLGMLFAFVLPFLLAPNLEPLEDQAVAADARRIAAEQGVSEVEVRVERVSEYTDSPNAYAAGLGPSRKVVLWDTFLDARFSAGEVAVVLAHEFAHHSRHHLWKGAAWFALFALPGTFVVARATRRRGGMREAEAVPLGLFVVVALQFLAQPVFNEFSRRHEAEADWVALESTRDPAAARRLFQEFTLISLQQPDPPTWSYVLHDTHPSVMERIAMAEAWRARRAR